MLIATDLDGTLLPIGSPTVSAYTADVLRAVDRAGIPVVFVTARPLRWMSGLWPHVGSHGRAVVSNGAITYDVPRRRVLTLAGIDPADGLDLTAGISRALPGARFAIECVDGIRLEPDFDDPIAPPAGSARGPLPQIWTAPAAKLLVRHPGLPADDLRSGVLAAVGDRAVVTWTVPGLMEISARGVTKSAALADLCRAMGVAQADVVAFGDMPNDIPMLTWAGTAYAMSDAHPSVQAVADHLAPPVDADGVARVLATLVPPDARTSR